jgi:hypothetical protein
VKFTYCPKCKELRTKPWYAYKDRCARCAGDVAVIPIPPSPLTYVVYALVVICFVLVYFGNSEDNQILLYGAVIGVVAAMVIQFFELARGEKYARAKIKPTKSDVDLLKAKGWGKDQHGKAL